MLTRYNENFPLPRRHLSGNMIETFKKIEFKYFIFLLSKKERMRLRKWKESNLPQCTWFIVRCTFQYAIKNVCALKSHEIAFNFFHTRRHVFLSFYFLCCHLIRRFIHTIHNMLWRRVGAKYGGKRNYCNIWTTCIIVCNEHVQLVEWSSLEISLF